MNEIHEALENATVNRNTKSIDPPANASDQDIEIYRKSLLRFLELLDDDLTVREIREELDAYQKSFYR